MITAYPVENGKKRSVIRPNPEVIRNLTTFKTPETVEPPALTEMRAEITELKQNFTQMQTDLNDFMNATPRVNVDLSEIYDVLTEFKNQIDTINENVKNLKERKNIPNIKITKK
jgi:archaellum component FlaC